eukprot:16428158-Heterocapsa_arctica.AAC.1
MPQCYFGHEEREDMHTTMWAGGLRQGGQIVQEFRAHILVTHHLIRCIFLAQQIVVHPMEIARARPGSP